MMIVLKLMILWQRNVVQLVVRQWIVMCWMADANCIFAVIIRTVLVMKLKKVSLKSRAMMVQLFHVISVMVKCNLKLDDLALTLLAAVVIIPEKF